MKIAMIAINDPAGSAINMTRALNQYTDHSCRLITRELRYNFLFEKDLHLPWLRNYDEVEDVLSSADVFHFHMTADEKTDLGPWNVSRFLKDQKIIHHHHGEPPFRAAPRSFADREQKLGRTAIVSTPDLMKGYPEAFWIPNAVPLRDPDYVPRGEYNHRYEIIVSHSPTRKELKNTAEFRDVMARVTRRNPRVRARIIEHTPHRDCLRMKKSSDVFFDHMQGYFGVSSLESLSQGVPTIAGLDDWNLEQIRTFAGREDVPWVLARKTEDLEKKMEDLVGDLSLRENVGRASRAWMESCWSEEKIAKCLSELYAQK